VDHDPSEKTRWETVILGSHGNYAVVTQYNSDAGPGPLVAVRIDTSDRTYLLEDVRVEEDPVVFMGSLGNKYVSNFER
jgi:hypothetical protein